MIARKSTVEAMETKLYEMLPPIHGTWYFVDPTEGSANRSGDTMSRAVASIVTAYGKCISGRGDGIAVVSRGITSAGTSSYLTAALDWTKWGITTVGLCAPISYSPRSRIVTASGTNDLVYIMDVQGSNNAFYNLQIANFGSGAGAVGGLKVTGDRNYFKRVHIMGGAGRVGLDPDYSLSIAASECRFDECIIGSDTWDMADKTNCNLLFAVNGFCKRNKWVDCEFPSSHAAGSDAGAIRMGGGASIVRDQVFDNCHFSMYRDGSITEETGVVIGEPPNNGFIIFRANCTRKGYTDWKAVDATFAARVLSCVPTNIEDGGQAVVANAS